MGKHNECYLQHCILPNPMCVSRLPHFSLLKFRNLTRVNLGCIKDIKICKHLNYLMYTPPLPTDKNYIYHSSGTAKSSQSLLEKDIFRPVNANRSACSKHDSSTHTNNKQIKCSKGLLSSNMVITLKCLEQNP